MEKVNESEYFPKALYTTESEHISQDQCNVITLKAFGGVCRREKPRCPRCGKDPIPCCVSDENVEVLKKKDNEVTQSHGCPTF